jgi:hypothetical protein
VAGDDSIFFGRLRLQLSEARGDISVRYAVEAVPPDFFDGEIFEWQPVRKGARRHGVMKRRIENGDLFGIRKMAAGGADRLEIVRIVKRRKNAQSADLFFHFVIDENGLMEEISAVNHAMSDSFNALTAERGPELLEGFSKSVTHIGDALDCAVTEPLRVGFRSGFGCDLEKIEFE